MIDNKTGDLIGKIVGEGLVKEVTFKNKSQVEKVQGQGGLPGLFKEDWCGSGKILVCSWNQKLANVTGVI